MEFIPFSKPQIGAEEARAVQRVLESGWLTTGKVTREFEREFEEYIGDSTIAIAVSSATAGLHLALEAIGISEGDEVITTTHTFTATAEVIRYLGADPVFVDIDKDTLCLDADQVEKKISSKTKAIIPVHFGGRPADMDKLIAIANAHRLKIIEDAAHALPSIYNGKKVGTLNTAATVFSFYANKTMTTGEGGMLVTKDSELAQRARTMRLHGINRDVFDRFNGKGSSWYYEVIAPGFKYNLTDLASSIGIEQLKKVDKFQRSREVIASFYNRALKSDKLELPCKIECNDQNSWHLYVVRLKDDLKHMRDEVIEGLSERGIGCSVHYIPLHCQPYWKVRYELNASDFPNSQEVYESCISIPLYSAMTKKEMERVAEGILDTVERL